MLRRSLTTTVSAAALSLGLVAAASAQTTLNGGGSTLVQPTIDQDFTQYTSTNPSVKFSFDGVGSGTGQTAFLTNNISLFNVPANQYGTIVGTTVHFAASDATFPAATITAYNTGSGLGTVDGPLIQIPTVGTPITIPYNNSTQKEELVLTDDQVCGVLSGKITNWNQISTSATAGQITVVYRSDGSGTSFLLTQHLSKVCTPQNSSFGVTYPILITKTFAQLFPSGFPAGSVFNGQSGSGAVASTLLATPLSIGYLSPDYTEIAPHSPSTTSLEVASVVNTTNGIAYQPTVKNTTTGLKNPAPGSTNATPPATMAAAADPNQWVPLIPDTTAGYPIVGYTTLDVSSCYADATAGAALNSFLKSFYSNDTYTDIATNNGFVALVNSPASRYVTALTNDFLTNASGYNLNIDNSAVCASTNKNHTGFAGR